MNKLYWNWSTTESITPWGQSHSRRADSHWGSQEIVRILWKPNVCLRVQKTPLSGGPVWHLQRINPPLTIIIIIIDNNIFPTKTAILGTSLFVRKVLQAETWSLSGGIHHWLKRRSTREERKPVTRDDDDDNNNNKLSIEFGLVMWYT
jgi:hypothetical protein